MREGKGRKREEGGGGGGFGNGSGMVPATFGSQAGMPQRLSVRRRRLWGRRQVLSVFSSTFPHPLSWFVDRHAWSGTSKKRKKNVDKSGSVYILQLPFLASVLPLLPLLPLGLPHETLTRQILLLSFIHPH